MPAPSTTAAFLDLVRMSGLLEEQRLQSYLQSAQASSSAAEAPAVLAAAMVRDGLLTQFQSEQLLLGKSRRFIIGGKYKFLERLGSGGMASVYLAEHLYLRRRVALKILPLSGAEEPAAVERFYREARACAAMDHPNIVRVHDIERHEKLHYLVLEYVDGPSLERIVRKRGPLEHVRAAHYMRQAAEGLEHAARAGLVHRDIKPANLLVNRQGIVKILDMGLARFSNDPADNLSHKYDETVLGTSDYLAPEQVLDSQAVDIRADIYSLGATFYFLLTGKCPFSEGTVAQKLIWHQIRHPKPIRSLCPQLPKELAVVLEKMMAKDRQERYQTPAEVAEALLPWTQTPIPPPAAEEFPQLSPAAQVVRSTDSSAILLGLARKVPPKH